MTVDLPAGDLPTGDLPTIGIGVDIGGTSTKAAVIDGLGDVIASITLPTRPGADGVVSTAIMAMLAVAKTAGLDLGSRMRIIDPSVPLGAIGAIRAAHEAGAASPVPLP